MDTAINISAHRIERVVAGLRAEDLQDNLPSAGAIHQYLEKLGYKVTGVSVEGLWRNGARDGDVSGYAVTVWADRDPTGDLEAFTPPPSPAEAARAELAAALAIVRAKADQSRTPAERAVLALARLLALG